MLRHYGKVDLRRLADDSGIGYSTASRLKGPGGALQLDVVEKVAKAFDLTASQLLDPDRAHPTEASGRGLDTESSLGPASLDAVSPFPTAAQQATLLAALLQSVGDNQRRQRAFETCEQILKLAQLPGQ